MYKDKKVLMEKVQEMQSKKLFRGRSDSKKSSINEKSESIYTSQSPRKLVQPLEEDSKEDLPLNNGPKSQDGGRESGEESTMQRRRLNRPTITLSKTGIPPKIILRSKGKEKEEASTVGTPTRKRNKSAASPTKYKSVSYGNNLLGVSELDQTVNQLKMDRSSLVMRTHMLSYQKRQRMNPVDQMIHAVQEDKINELEELFMIYPNSLIDSRDSSNNTLLLIASKTGSLEIVQLLLNKGANPNSINDQGDSALHFALAFGNHEVADKLITYGADQTIKNNMRKTPWDLP